MTPKLKFLRRVRIYGGECGAVARALHHEAQKDALMSYERAFLCQADAEKAFGSTLFERKQMSTKTTLKRIALVAVSALGFGMFTAVVPANAAPATITSIVVGTVPVGRVDVTSSIPFKIYISGMTAGDTLNINAEITAAPLSGGASNRASALGASYVTADVNDNASGADFGVSSASSSFAAFNAETLLHGRVDGSRNGLDADGSADDGTDLAAGSSAPDTAITAAQVAAGFIQGYVRITPDVTGSYTGLISTTYYPGGTTFGSGRSATANQVYAAGDKSASFTFTTTGAPTAVSLSTLAGGTLHGGSTYGSIVAVTLTGGTLGALDSIDLVASGTGLISTSVTSPGSYAAQKSLTSANFAGGQTALVLLKASGTTAETVTLTAASSGALTAFSTVKTYTVQAATGSATALVADVYGADTTYGDANGSISSTTVTVSDKSTSQTLGWTWAGAAAKNGFYSVVDTQGKLTGVATAKYDVAYSTAATTAGISLSFAVDAASLATSTTLFQVIIPAGSATTTIGMGSATTYTVSSSTRAASGATFTITPTTAGNKYQVAAGGGVAMTALLKDKFDVAWSGQTVTITTSGRNNPVATTAVTDAAGKVTFTSVDSSTSTTSLTDTVVFSATNATSKTITLDYANTAASTVVLTGGSTTAGVTALTPTNLEINAATAGAQATTHTVTALVKDASGNAIVGKLVTWSISGTGCALLSTRGTSYTSTTGEATTSAYGWLQGTCTVTATVGTVSGTASLYFVQTGTAEARTVTATVSAAVVTANVKDRYGNPIKGVTIYATKTGTGYFGSGLGRTTAVTDLRGNAQFSIAGGDADVTVSVVDYDLPAGSTFGQTCALAGKGTCPTAAGVSTSLTATTVGTTTTAETGVGASYDAAGVASATVSVKADTSARDAADAATDAAAEAIDAANAATDAANLAAEAADAATVAAEEARDAADAATAAVEELATQVATLMAALKAQITTLANTVAKIAKKVKA